MHDERFKDVFRRLTARTPQPPEFAELEIQHATPGLGTQAKPWMVLVGAAAAVLLIVGAVSILTNTAPSEPEGVASPAPTTTAAPFSIPADCPVTIPGGGFTPPESHPESPSSWPDSVWHGTDELWTVLAIDGNHGYRKSVWWSANFPGGGVEQGPPISATWRLLNSERDVMLQINDGTNAYTVEDGWFMISGIDPNYTGCWEVTAHYKGATLSYVYYLADGLDSSQLGVVPDVVGMTVGRAENVLHDAYYEASPFDSTEPDYEVCAQEPGAGLEIGAGSTIGLRTAPQGKCAQLLGPSGLNEAFSTYSDGFGRVYYSTACSAADVLVSGGVAAADGLPNTGQTYKGRVESLVASQGADFASTYEAVSIDAVPRNGEVWDRNDDGDVVVEQVTDYMVQITLTAETPCPAAPLSWNGVPVAFVRVSEEQCLGAAPGPAQIAVYFHCGPQAQYPIPTGVSRPLDPGTDPITARFAQMLRGPSPGESARGFGSFFSQDTEDALITADVTAGHLIVDFTDDILVNNASTTNGSNFFLAELYANAFEPAGVEVVEFRINGSCEAFWSFLQAGEVCDRTTRVEWEVIRARWDQEG